MNKQQYLELLDAALNIIASQVAQCHASRHHADVNIADEKKKGMHYSEDRMSKLYAEKANLSMTVRCLAILEEDIVRCIQKVNKNQIRETEMSLFDIALKVSYNIADQSHWTCDSILKALKDKEIDIYKHEEFVKKQETQKESK
jgi:hypothetical protein